MDNLSWQLAIIISFAISLLILWVLYGIQSYIHEYGHVLKLKEMIYKYKKDIETNIVRIQVAKFGTWKIKAYSDYFEILENNNQKTKYQIIIKDIAINGYEFSKQIIPYKLFGIICFIIWIITPLLIIFTILYNNPLLTLLSNILALIMYIIFSYFLLCEVGYGPNKSKSKEKSFSDHYIYFHPNEFKYLTLEADKENLQKEHKIILDIIIDLTNQENPKTNIIFINIFYNCLNKKFPLD